MTDTITAIATPPGRGGVGIIRISGSLAALIAQKILGQLPTIRMATYGDFTAPNGELIDQGLALYFKAPHSFTGEDVVELQGHGGPVVMDKLLHCIISLGARLARPGEFSERAFLNDKIDLVQAEAIADLIDAASEQAASSAIQSLSGKFSERINVLIEQLIHCRMYVEAAIDFPEEEINFLDDPQILKQLEQLTQQLVTILRSAEQGVLLREGLRVVIAGKPNAGKSSLLNALSGTEAAIVTAIPGTTRDVVRQHIQLAGIPIHLSDTAGLRITDDIVEKEGVRRTEQEIVQADHLLYVIDSSDPAEDLGWQVYQKEKLTLIYNKIDKSGQQPKLVTGSPSIIYVCAHNQQGLDLLRNHLTASFHSYGTDSSIVIARRRHLVALQTAQLHITNAMQQLTYQAGELVAEELRLAQNALEEITGKFSSDDLLERIFRDFCIGK